jgi:NAD(P)-dependent dehydrogenase (short-subunit alcohol dehydrogenase family)
VLITGCGSGIGRAAAVELAAAGHIVYATARRRESVDELAVWADAHPERVFARQLNVTESATIDPVVKEMLSAHGRIDAVVNNAGFGQVGAVEDVGLDLWRRQFETNLFGAIAVIQAVLPTMRSRGRGRIVNVSSVVAHATVPLMGAYCASKHALEAMSTALRVEVAGLGIEVVLIEPGPIQTQFRPNINASLEKSPIHEGSPYEAMYRALDAYWSRRYGRPARSAEEVAFLVRKAIEARRPRRRYRITSVARIAPWLLPFIPDGLMDRVLRKQLGE